MAIDLYYHPMSAPCRAVRMAAEALGVKLDLKLVDIMTGEHMKPEYIKMNPRHSIPTIDDGGFYLSESRSILQYLANAYSKNDTFYPRPAKQRALVDQMLQFDMGALYSSFAEAYYPVAFEKQKLNEDKVKKLDTNLEFLEEVLTKWKYSAGDDITIADYTIISTLSTAEACGHNLSKYNLVFGYLNKCKKEIKNYKELNQDGADVFKTLIEAANNGS